MGIDITDGQIGTGTKKKTPSQLQSLEKFYSDEKYPKQIKLEEYASALNLTYNQVRVWFSERRRKEKRNSIIKSFPTGSSFQTSKFSDSHRGTSGTSLRCAIEKMDQLVRHKGRYKVSEHLNKSHSGGRINNAEHKHHIDLQTSLPKDYILSRIFRKDGPSLGLEFDPPPGNAFGHNKELQKLQACHDSQQIPKRTKVSVSPILSLRALPENNLPTGKHGMGKGLMTVWCATQPNEQNLPDGVSFTDRSTWRSLRSNASHKATSSHVSRHTRHSSQKKLQDKRKQERKKIQVPSKKDINQTEPYLKDCSLSLDECLEQSSELITLVDDEELELEELQAGPNPLKCSAHLSSNGRHGCPLCKDLLARFPPDIVRMKQLFSTRPWDSSSELVKKLFKVLQFIYRRSTIIDVCPFTVDEFAQAFHDKDSLLLGKIHVALLNLLMLDAEKELTSGSTPRASKVCRCIVFLNFVREQNFDINQWRKSLTPLTWAEILRQVLIAAGFGSKHNMVRKGNNKERNQMEKYGLHHRTLKGELFSLLSKQGSGGLKISELARVSQIVELDLPNTTEELEQLIYSTLSSDITLFEKIAPSAYRLRVDPHIKGKSDSQSDTEDSGSVDDESNASASCSSDDSEVDSAIQDWQIVKCKVRHKKTSQDLTEYMEIDESYSGEAWMQGLMEGEYINLSIEEKLDALVALIDVVGACSGLRIEEAIKPISVIPNIQYRGSGAKIKKNCQVSSMPLLEGNGNGEATLSHSALHTSVSSVNTCSNKRGCQSTSPEINNSEVKEVCKDVHPMQSIFLGSDRRYNDYWLFLGPCAARDPGHRRVYFESSEDGHWEVIDTAQALHALLSILDSRGTREARLIASLEKRKSFLCQAMHEHSVMHSVAITGSRQTKSSEPSSLDATSGGGSSPTSDIDNVLIPSKLDSLSVSPCAIDLEIGRSSEEKRQRWYRLQSYDRWIWNSFYSTLNSVRYGKRSYMESLAHCENCHDLYWRDEKHCKTCHTTFEIDFDLEERYAIHIATCREPEDVGEFPKHKVLPSQLQVLKASVHAIESSMPEAALAGTWRASAHKLWVKRLRRASSLPEFLQVLTDFVGAINGEWLCECLTLNCDMAADDVIINFQTMPQTTSAVALWIFKLDTLIAPHLGVQAERSPVPEPQLKRRRTCVNS
ncbi:homeobox-DDT domain protein RLT3 [Canna indica]|uniref:Homeobox-DDT domain protein RLT3 n=1 Tax=Canna indica TaxID=4628 RepID=A0AAQ3K302_9LILI|nr:homeobox-DDT domain protein RLT3 [Canna indica]